MTSCHIKAPSDSATCCARFVAAFAVAAICLNLPLSAAGQQSEESRQAAAAAAFHSTVQPFLENYCYDCHADGSSEGGVQLDGFADDAALLADRQLWSRVLKNVRAGVMPPAGEAKPSAEQTRELAQWIKRGPFNIDPDNIDPGRVTIHRLNRREYRNTVRDLLGVDYNTDVEFPPDAAGMGLDNIADLLSVSPLMLEKYLNAAEAIVAGAYPAQPIQSVVIQGHEFRGNNNTSGDFVTFNNPPEITYTYRNATPGKYLLKIKLSVVGLTQEEQRQIAEVLAAQEKAASEPPAAESENTPQPDVAEDRDRVGRRRSGRRDEEEPAPPRKPTTEAHFVATVQSGTDSETTLIDRVFTSEPGEFEFVIPQLWSVEPHKLNFNVIMPDDGQPRQRRRRFRRRRRRVQPLPAPHIVVESMTITPQPTAAGSRYFPLDTPPSDAGQRREYIRDGIAKFGRSAFRRPLDETTLLRLVNDIESSIQAGREFAASIKPAMAKLLCSPRFLFRASIPLAAEEQLEWGRIDEYSLASRLSYFLWSSTPDDELLDLAGRGQLRENLESQVDRMLADERIEHFIENFTGQWLQTRNVRDWTIVEPAVLAREGIESRTPLLTNQVRLAMEREATAYFAHVLREDKSVLDFIDSDYTFLNAALAEFYDIPDVAGPEMRLVRLPEGSPRGGMITAGSTLLVTSTTNRTSPVKRGVFVMENFLGLKPRDPPPDVPSVEAASSGISEREPSFREMLELHRQDTLCASCHSLMDPIGLALDNFNAIGRYRQREFDQPIDASGQLASGEQFQGAEDLKSILRNNRREDFYRCLTNKLMTYALGRGLEYYDSESIDQIVDRLMLEDGRFSELLMGIIYSTPFQKRRNLASPEAAGN